MRFSNATDIYMSTAYGRQTCHFEFYLWNRKDRYNDPSGSLAAFQTIIQLIVSIWEEHLMITKLLNSVEPFRTLAMTCFRLKCFHSDKHSAKDFYWLIQSSQISDRCDINLL